MHAAGFNASTDGGVQDNGAAQAAAGINGMVWVDAYNNATCAQTLSNSQIQAMVQANVSAGMLGLRYQIGDEPTANGCNAPPVYASITAAVHAVDASAKTWTDDDQFQIGNPVIAGIPMQGTVDILAFDVYPCESGPCQYSAIDSAVAQIHAAHLTNWEFILQDFSSSPWRWPTPTEIQAQFDHWKNQGAIGYWVFAWDYQGQQVISQAGNIAALQSVNSQAMNSSSPPPSPSPSPAPSTSPGPSPSASPSPDPLPSPSPSPSASPSPTPPPPAPRHGHHPRPHTSLAEQTLSSLAATTSSWRELIGNLAQRVQSFLVGEIMRSAVRAGCAAHICHEMSQQ
jgi:hypothetical protein